MRTHFVAIAAIAALFGLSTTVRSEDPKPADAVDLLFLSPGQPLLMRLHLKVDGKSYDDRFDAFVRQRLTALDADKDGVLKGDELKRLPRPDDLSSAESKADAENIDEPTKDLLEDQQMTFEELRTYIRRVAGPGLSLQLSSGQTLNGYQVQYQYGGQTNPGQALFKHLDGDHDRKLDVDELRSGMDRLAKLDRDDDGSVSIEEANPQSPYGYYVQQQTPVMTPILPFVVLKPRVEQRMVRKFVQQYDRAEEGQTPDLRLTRTELPWPETWFNAADKNSDTEIDYDEVQTLLEHPLPQLECTLYLGDKWARTPAIEVDRRDPLLKADVRRAANGDVTVFFGQAQIEFSVPPVNDGMTYASFYLQQLKASDSDNNGYVERKESQNNYYIQQAFSAADADKDGKLYAAEFESYINSRSAAGLARTVLSIADSGRNLFEILDANRDRRVGAKELAAIENEVSAWDGNQDGGLSPNEIPQHFRVSIRPGMPNIAALQFAFAAPTTQSVPAPANLPTATPVWFRKMDRNSDGDVARREFLGPQELFDRIDADHNGHVDSNEAERAGRKP